MTPSRVSQVRIFGTGGFVHSILPATVKVGARPDASSCAYLECELRLICGDRLVLYTDGLIEPENARGESFGDRELGQVIKASQALASSALAERLLSALNKWQPRSAAQQDDITLLVMDIVEPVVAESVSWPAVAAAGVRADRAG
jgi:hypothetical protein